jgi:hypothetical protein
MVVRLARHAHLSWRNVCQWIPTGVDIHSWCRVMPAGQNFTESELGTLQYSAAVGRAWALANHRALKWAGNRATAVRGTHSVVRCGNRCLALSARDPVTAFGQIATHKPMSRNAIAAQAVHVALCSACCRIEDFCNHSRAPAAVRTMLRNAQVPHNETVVQQAVVRLKNSRCHVGYWQVSELLVRAVANLLSRRVERFGGRRHKACWPYQPLRWFITRKTSLNRLVKSIRLSGSIRQVT